MARLDRLGPAKEVAQIGAVIGREFSHALLAAVVGKSEAELQSALDRLVDAGLVFRQGIPPHASYLFKHALVQEAAYTTLLRESRRALHARIAETLESQFAEIAENQPELLARHAAEAGQIEKAASLWGKAGQRSLDRSALVEAVTQITQALNQIAVLPASPALRSQQIKLQVALITPLMHLKGHAAPETKAVLERARFLIEQSEAVGEQTDDPLLLFSVLFGLWGANLVASDLEVCRDLAAQFLTLAEKQGTAIPRMVGHRAMGVSLATTGAFTEGRAHYDQAISFYDPKEHRPLATRFSVDVGVGLLCYRSWTLWALGCPDAALGDIDHALKLAREVGQAPTLMHALAFASSTLILSRNHTEADALLKQLVALADEKGALYWKAWGSISLGWLLVLSGKPSDAVQIIATGIATYQSTGAKIYVPLYLSYLARAHAEAGQIDEALRCIDEAMIGIGTTGQRMWEAEVHRLAGEIALKSPEPDAANAQQYFDRALSVARQQQAKSWELRTAMSLARLWRDQGKVQQARELLAPVYGWFTEGFDTRDLKEAKALLDEL